MPTKFLGKVLFPKLPAWQARRQARNLLAAVSVAVIFGCIVAAIFLFEGLTR